jgi:SAM-dependent methyltransferase
MIPAGSLVLDLGGDKIRKRGQFDIEQYNVRVVYANISSAKRPDILADAAYVPFRSNSFDAIVCSELLEHVLDPPSVLREVHRLLRSQGEALICVPFLFRIHGAPHDYGRYTDYYWLQTLRMIGFYDIEIEEHGLFWSVIIDMLRSFFSHVTTEKRLWSVWTRRQLVRLAGLGRKAALRWEAKPEHQKHPFYSSFTTGFGIRAMKR